jgi:hypothetical protein
MAASYVVLTRNSRTSSGKDSDKELANRILKQLKPVLLRAPQKIVSPLAPRRRSAVQLSQSHRSILNMRKRLPSGDGDYAVESLCNISPEPFICLEHRMGFEPMNTGFAVRNSSVLSGT